MSADGKSPGQVAYEAHAQHHLYLTARGNTMPTWNQLSPRSQTAWRVGVEAAIKQFVQGRETQS